MCNDVSHEGRNLEVEEKYPNTRYIIFYKYILIHPFLIIGKTEQYTLLCNDDIHVLFRKK